MIETKISRTATPSYLVCYRESRSAFNLYASCGEDPREAGLSPMACLQIDLMRWERKCFGLQSPHTSALGVIEELGELEEAKTEDDVIDAIGDTLVFATNLCTKMRLDMGTIISFAESMSASEHSWSRPEIMGQLAHVMLKADQGIRGYDDLEVARRDTCIVLHRIVQNISQPQLSRSHGWDVGEILDDVATKVMKRSWDKDAFAGGTGTFEAVNTPAPRGRK